MKDYAVLTNDGKYTIFEFNNQRIRFITSDKLERYTKVVEWDNGYLVVMAKKGGEYIAFTALSSIYPINIFKSSSTFVIPAIPKLSTKTLATFGDKNAGSVGPRCMFLTPR